MRCSFEIAILCLGAQYDYLNNFSSFDEWFRFIFFFKYFHKNGESKSILIPSTHFERKKNMRVLMYNSISAFLRKAINNQFSERFSRDSKAIGI